MRRNGIHASIVALLVGTLAAGCTSPEWNGPEVETGLAAQPVAVAHGAKGTLAVATSVATRHDELEPAFRGFAVFDAQGALVYSTRGTAGLETLRLAAGRYTVVSLVGQGLTDRHMERRPALVAGGCETLVDFERAAPAVSKLAP